MSAHKPDTSVDWLWRKSKQDVTDVIADRAESLRALADMQKNRPLKPPGKVKQ